MKRIFTIEYEMCVAHLPVLNREALEVHAIGSLTEQADLNDGVGL